MKTFLCFSLFALILSLVLSGCVTLDSSSKEDEATARSALSEELLKVKQDMSALKGQLEEMQYKIDRISQSQSQQSAELNTSLKDLRKETQGSIEKRVSSIETKLELLDKKETQDIKQANDKMSIIVEEISKENKELRRQIDSLKRAPAQKIQPTAQSSISSQGEFYVVSAGDTLVKIAQMHGVSLKSIMEANNITDANSIHVGQKLTIPQKK